MKDQSTVKKRIKFLETDLTKKVTEYKELDQLSAGDSQGRLLDEKIQKMKGEIVGLKWVLS